MLANVGYRRWSYLLLIASLSIISVATIYPFKFVVPQGLSVKSILESFNYSSSIKDYTQNILLFIPLGISLAAIAVAKQVRRTQRSRRVIASHQRLSNWSILILGCLISAAVSTTVELTQLFLPIRVSNLTDIICNSLGGVVGGFLYCWRKDLINFAIGVIKADRRRLSLKSLSLAIVSYCTIVAVAIWILLINANLSNWNEDFYLAIGNEITGDRPWNGYLNSLYLSDRSLERSQVAAALENPDRFFSRSDNVIVSLNTNDRSVQNSEDLDLFWYDVSTSDPVTKLKINGDYPLGTLRDRVAESWGILLNKEQWLKTVQPVFFINQQLKNSSEFSLFLDLATNDLTLNGPARIITISDGIYVQNLLIGQAGQDLVFRLRTPITGNDPTQPEFILPDFFQDYSDRQVLITFAKRKLTLYLSKVEQYIFVFNPSVSFYSYLPWNISNWKVNLKELNTLQYQQFFYSIVILPLIVLFGELIYLFFLRLLYD